MAEPQTKTAAKCKEICPHFVVPDVVALAEHYRDVLGFKIRGNWLDPPVFVIVAHDAVEIHHGKSGNGGLPSPNIARREGGLDAYIWVNDLDALYAELRRVEIQHGQRKSGIEWEASSCAKIGVPVMSQGAASA